MKSLIFAIALFSAFVDADPEPTSPTPRSLSSGTFPASTTQAPAVLLGWQAPDNTCGYVGGLLNYILTCNSGACDALTTGLPNAGRHVACCAPESGCQFFSACIESLNFSASSRSCSEYCRTNVVNVACYSSCGLINIPVRCTASDKPYCVGYSFSEWKASFYGCTSTPVSTVKVIQTTFSGETGSRIWAPVFSNIGTSISYGANIFTIGGQSVHPYATIIQNGGPNTSSKIVIGVVIAAVIITTLTILAI